MRNNPTAISMTTVIVFEWLFIYTLLVPFYSGHWQLFTPLLFLAAIFGVLFALVRSIFPKASMAAYFLITLVTVVAGYVIFNFHPLVALIVGVLFYFGSTRLYEKRTSETVWLLFFAYTVIAVAYYMFVPFLMQGVFQGRFIFILLLAVQFLAAILMIYSVNLDSGMSQGMPLFIIGFFIVSLAVAGFILVLKPVLFSIVNFLIRGAAFIIIEVMAFLFNLLVTPFVSEKKDDKLKQVFHMSDSPMKDQQHFADYQPPNVLIWVAVAILVCLAVVIVIILRKRKLRADSRENHTQEPLFGEAIDTNVKKKFNRKKRQRPPKDPVRLGMYKIHRFARKLGAGRYSYESLDEWLVRTDPSAKASSRVKALYDKARYGGQLLTREELADYSAALKHMKEDFKNRKMLKDNIDRNE
ncbi:hypothetical protein EV207_102285 [Scopulibacillus darangshiensis]|uniref:DUF4129 domain-containing protein n=1 Tax=Scopulibacillus darangshiensis TaxID=442528 RepID=A0A4R2PA18_9BACL|nr:hypothetical protein [Scopulibacillus darangshiensis]TCP31792.1 hypothetical protein EV207_102285 [Scopulibacillus darangshiensis]